MNRVIFIIVICVFQFELRAQSSDEFAPTIGKHMPGFKLNNVTHFDAATASLEDFKGKWLFLDFWFTGCKGCITSFPKASLIQEQFHEELNWVLVGANNLSPSKNSMAIQIFYEKLRTMQNLKMVSAYDSILYMKWGITSMPHIYIIDPDGILRAVTSGRDITMEKVQNLIDGKDVSFHVKEEDRQILTLASVDGNDKSMMVYGSIIEKWNGERQMVYDISQYVKKPSHTEWNNGFRLNMIPLYGMYNIAFFGKWYLKNPRDTIYSEVYPVPILEVRDTLLFEYDYQYNVGKGTYNYILKIPPSTATQEKVMQLMQEDLKRAFGFDAAIVVREMPVWKLVATPETAVRLKTKGGKPYSSESEQNVAAGFSVRNVSIPAFLAILTSYVVMNENTPFVDATGIQGNIDLSLNADVTSFEAIKESLPRYGLALVKGIKEMKVLVIRDSPN